VRVYEAPVAAPLLGSCGGRVAKKVTNPKMGAGLPRRPPARSSLRFNFPPSEDQPLPKRRGFVARRLFGAGTICS